MTTIAYRDGVLAADSSCWVDTTRVHSARKIWRVHGGLIGFAGTISYGLAMVRWLQSGADPDDYPKESNGSCIIIDRRGIIRSYESGSTTSMRIVEKYVSIGSGSSVALGAMFAGANAKDAIKASIKYDAYTSGPIKTLRLHA